MNLCQRPPFQKTASLRGTATETRYFAWLHSYRTCCLTGRPDIELAHTGGAAEGKGMARKAWLHTVLPLARALHHAEESNRAKFWHLAGFPHKEHLAYAERLFEVFEQGDDPSALLADMQWQADRGYLAQFLKR